MKSRLRFCRGAVCAAVALAIASAVYAQDSKEKPKGNGKQPDAKSDAKQPDAKQSKEPAKTDDGRAQLLKAYELSKTAKSAKEFSEIIDLCEKGIAATEAPGFKAYGQKLVAWAYYKRGDAYAGESPPKDKEALADFDAAVKLLADVRSGERPDWEFDLLHNRGVSNAMTGEYDKALEDFNRVLEMRPNYGKEYFNRGEIYYAKGELAKAIAEYGLALRYGYGESVVYTRRGATYFKLDETNRALTDYNQAIARNPRDYEAYTHRGDLHAGNGNFAQAMRDYLQAIELNDKYDRVYLSAGWLRATCRDQQFRDADLALRSGRKAVELGGEGARSLRVLAAAQARAGQFGEAIANANKALEKAKGDTDEEELLKRMLEGFEAKKAYESVASTGAKAPEKTPEKQKKQP